MMAKKNKNKEITLDDLAVMVQRGFVDTEERLGASIDKLDNKIDNKIDGLRMEMREKFEEVGRKLDSLERRIIFLEDKITEHSKELKEIKTLIKKYQKDRETDYQKIISLERRVERLEAKVFTA